MQTLTKWIPRVLLDVAWETGPKLKFVDGRWGGDDRLLASMAFGGSLHITAMTNYTLYHFMKRGPVVIHPDPALAAALMDTEIRVPSSEYHQPYEVMAVVDGDRLVFVWHAPPLVSAWVLDQSGYTFYTVAGNDTPTIEDQIVSREWTADANDYRVLVQGGRMAINACMLAAHRETVLTELPRDVRHHRMARQRDLRRRAHEHFQEVRFRDLVIRPRPEYDAMDGFGSKMAKQRRSGHWRRVPHGPQASLRRWTWINEYETRPDEDWPGGKGPTTIIK